MKLIRSQLDKLNIKKNEEYFGEWIKNIENVKESIECDPYKHIIIDNFLNDEYVEKINKEMPIDYENWHKYHNPIEVKYANNNIDEMGENIRKLFYILSTDEITKKFSEIFEIEDLEYDPYLHGAGLHAHPRLGRLHLHLDYEKHPILKDKERRLNIILYLTKDWDDKWNGNTELWNKDVSECRARCNIRFNRAIVFVTNNLSWHGLPDKILCPEGLYRKSLAYYYISPLDKINNGSFRVKARFIKRPSDPDLPQMKKLYEIRPNRRIENSDMERIFPEWTPEYL